MRLIFAVLLLVALLIAKPAAGEAPYDINGKGKIAFITYNFNEPVSYTISVMTVNPDGSGVQQLDTIENTEANGDLYNCYCEFQWSPDYNNLRLFINNGQTPDQTIIVRADGQGSLSYSADYFRFKWSPDGKYLGYLYRKDKKTNVNNGELYIADGNGQNPQRFTDRNITDFAWSPDGKQLAISSLGSIYITPIEGEPKLKRLTTNDVHVDGLNWLLHGTKISFIYRSKLYTVDVKTMLRQKLNITMLSKGYMASPDGQKLVNGSTILDLETGLKHPIPDVNDFVVGILGFRMVWSPDSSKLLYNDLGDPRGLIVWDLSSDVPTNVYTVDFGSRDGVWSPDITQIAYLDYKDICVVGIDGTGKHCIIDTTEYGDIAELQWAYVFDEME